MATIAIRGEPMESIVRNLLLALLIAAGLAACSVAPPAGVAVVTQFDLARYEGRWYEIARLDHAFERGLTDVTAMYTRQPDGSVKVVNRGYDPQESRWREATGRAEFIGAPTTASLKVSFFGPFYGGYNVVELDRAGYRWAMVLGPDRDYLWILARERTLPEDVRRLLVDRAAALGVNVDKLVWVSQTRTEDRSGGT
jgi:apolipoprotein D and lipocalin family protein